jgi:transposase-like protein
MDWRTIEIYGRRNGKKLHSKSCPLCKICQATLRNNNSGDILADCSTQMATYIDTALNIHKTGIVFSVDPSRTKAILG